MELTNAVVRPACLRTALPALLVLSACAGEPSPAREDSAPSEPLAQQAQTANKTLNSKEMQALTDAEGTFFAAVRAEGSGCPEGTLNTRVSSDGQVFTTTFAAYDIRIDASSDAMTRDCRFVVMLDSPGGRSFCVKQFGYSGNAFLQAGVSGRQVASYSFNEQTLATESSRQELVGPYDADFVFTDIVEAPEEVWTPCGEQRDLIIDTKLELNNGTPRAGGLINISAADGQNSVQFQLASHRCDMARADGWTVGPFTGRTDTMAGDVPATEPEETPVDEPTPDEEEPTPDDGATGNTGNTGNTGTTSGNRGNTGTTSGNRGNTGTTSGNRGNTGSTSSSGNRSGPSIGTVTRGGTSVGSVGRTVR